MISEAATRCLKVPAMNARAEQKLHTNGRWILENKSNELLASLLGVSLSFTDIP